MSQTARLDHAVTETSYSASENLAEISGSDALDYTIISLSSNLATLPFRDLQSIPATQFSLDPSRLQEFKTALNDDLLFTTKPAGTGIPPGSKLLEIRHKPITKLDDIRHIFLSDKRIWIRVRDPESIKRKLSEDSVRILSLYYDWVRYLPPLRSMWPKQIWPHTAAADACASGDRAQIGGFITLDDTSTYWFSERFCAADFKNISIPVNSEM